MNNTVSASLLFLSLAMVCSAGPVTTVPWNGYTGAASFGYDDARGSQLTTEVQQQFDKAGIKATFFISNMYTFPSQKSDWIAMAKKGHELANHTSDHKEPTTSNVSSMATTLRALDPSVQSVTLAYPGCTVTGQSAVGAESFLARGCQWNNETKTSTNFTFYAWTGSEPNWMNILGLCIQPGNADRATDMLDGAKSRNSWAVLFTHDVKSGPDTYSTTPADHQKILDRAVSNKLWISTYQEVGAYYRAHFTMDAATATKNGSNWDVKWTSPHPKMPKVVKLRVKLDAATFGTGFTVSQNNVAIAPESDGSYVIDFMKLSMTVAPKGTAVQPRAWQLPSDFGVRLADQGIAVSGFGHDVEVRVTDVRGATLFQGRSSRGLVPVAKERRSGLLLVTLVDPVSGALAQRTLNAIH